MREREFEGFSDEEALFGLTPDQILEKVGLPASEGLRDVIHNAENQAASFGRDYITGAEFLLGLLVIPESIEEEIPDATQLLIDHGANLDLGRRLYRMGAGIYQFSPLTTRPEVFKIYNEGQVILLRAAREAKLDEMSDVRSMHLVSSIAIARGNLTGYIIRNMGIDPNHLAADAQARRNQLRG